MKRRQNNNGMQQHNSDKDRYLITYADLITLLLGLFVILYASSQVDSEKFKELSTAFTKYFKSEPAKILEGGEGVLEANRRGVPEPLLLPSGAKSIDDVEKGTREALASYIDSGLINLRSSDKGLVVVLPEKLLFRSGRAEIQPEGLNVIDTLSRMLSNINFSIQVDGHTDSTPIRTFQFESNWHLSVARALNVGYRMIRAGVSEEYFVIRGFGSLRPVADNLTPEGRSQNRRVEITISQLSDFSPANLLNGEAQ